MVKQRSFLLFPSSLSESERFLLEAAECDDEVRAGEITEAEAAKSKAGGRVVPMRELVMASSE